MSSAFKTPYSLKLSQSRGLVLRTSLMEGDAFWTSQTEQEPTEKVWLLPPRDPRGAWHDSELPVSGISGNTWSPGPGPGLSAGWGWSPAWKP